MRKKDDRTRISVRLNDDEKLEFLRKLKKSGMTVQNFVLRSCLNKKIVETSAEKIQAEKEIAVDLKRIGNNINQLTRICNINHAKPELEELRLYRQEMEKLWQFLKSQSQEQQ